MRILSLILISTLLASCASFHDCGCKKKKERKIASTPELYCTTTGTLKKAKAEMEEMCDLNKGFSMYGRYGVKGFCCVKK
jgi:hypothetical protein